MPELSFVGLSDDAASLILSDSDGVQHSVPLDDRLSAAVRAARSRRGTRELEGNDLSPRDIQTLVRAGASAESVAETYGADIERVRRYEGPVLAEREFVAAQAQAVEFRGDEGSRLLGDLVTARLRARGIDSGTLTWDAWRREDGHWTIALTWTEGAAAGQASWAYDTVGRTITPVDEDAAWLIETSIAEDDESRPHLIGLPSVVEDVVEVEFVEVVAEIPTPWAADDDRYATGPVTDEPEEAIAPPEPAPTPRRARKSKRASVPSWDEILFGSRDPEN